MEEKPNYYAVIPANVRYDADLRASAKLMYGEITALSSKYGVCTASNNYFARLYEVDASAISKWITQLKNKKYIEVEYETNGKEIKKRIIRIIGTDKCQYVLPKDNGGYCQKDKENNTSNTNNTSIKEIYKEKEICKRVIDKLNELNNTKYSPTSESTLKFIKGRLKDGYTEEDLMLVVEKMSYLWHQPGEKDMTPYLRPSTLFRPTNFENYLNMPIKNKQKGFMEIMKGVRDKYDN